MPGLSVAHCVSAATPAAPDEAAGSLHDAKSREDFEAGVLGFAVDALLVRTKDGRPESNFGQAEHFELCAADESVALDVIDRSDGLGRVGLDNSRVPKDERLKAVLLERGIACQLGAGVLTGMRVLSSPRRPGCQ